MRPYGRESFSSVRPADITMPERGNGDANLHLNVTKNSTCTRYAGNGAWDHQTSRQLIEQFPREFVMTGLASQPFAHAPFRTELLIGGKPRGQKHSPAFAGSVPGRR
jgi:hypothetical protein